MTHHGCARAAVVLLCIGLEFASANPVDSGATLFWCVADVRPGETLLCALDQGPSRSGGTGNLTLRIAPSSSAVVSEVAATLSPSGDSVSAVMPATMPPGTYSVQLLGADGFALSGAYTVNNPEVWWAQGDRGAAAHAQVGAVSLGARTVARPEVSP